ncbi:MAG: bifunctional 3-deoxy-7-phosphoheptulonate synthase/chorismate mutase type II, partial [Prevotellaceae bacterium]|nr:bifunctional 3-deoxy-7-phosphoheptulonate synthase/chorismate mutase type II [Prevotellaceae bacterium]
GRREYLYEILQKATDLAYDGWMIESHVRPDEAWSDAAQQITPPELVALAQKIVQRAPSSANADFIGKLQDMRMQIDWIDDQLVDLLAQRMKVSDDIGEQKKVNNVAILQSHRRNELLQKALDKGEAAGFAPAFIEELFELIHQESINRQTKIMNE